MALAGLLTAAGIVKGNALQHRGILEIGDMRVVERDVAVFAETYEREINGGLGKKTRVPFDFRIEVRRIAGDIMDCLRMHFVGDARADPQAKTRGVVFRKADVFVHMKHLHRVPGNAGELCQRRDQIKCDAVAHDDPGTSALIDGMAYDGGQPSPPRRRPAASRAGNTKHRALPYITGP